MQLQIKILSGIFTCVIVLTFGATVVYAQDATTIMKSIQLKLDKINDYEASAELKTEISFLKVPDALVKIYYKKPDKIKIKNEKGISLVPKETVSISLYSLVSSKYQALDAGTDQIGGIPVRIIKLLPNDENAELVLATVYIDTKRLLILKAKTTTKENGTNEVSLIYGRFESLGLPDEIIFTFNTQDFKLPKGVTFDYDDGSVKNKPSDSGKNQHGKIQITYKEYQVNKGLSDGVFQ
jgi:hypothetical protein